MKPVTDGNQDGLSVLQPGIELIWKVGSLLLWK